MWNTLLCSSRWLQCSLAGCSYGLRRAFQQVFASGRCFPLVATFYKLRKQACDNLRGLVSLPKLASVLNAMSDEIRRCFGWVGLYGCATEVKTRDIEIRRCAYDVFLCILPSSLLRCDFNQSEESYRTGRIKRRFSSSSSFFFPLEMSDAKQPSNVKRGKWMQFLRLLHTAYCSFNKNCRLWSTKNTVSWTLSKPMLQVFCCCCTMKEHMYKSRSVFARRCCSTGIASFSGASAFLFVCFVPCSLLLQGSEAASAHGT